MTIKEVTYASSLYEASKQFRERVLRKPLGRTLSAKDLEDEGKQIHVVALDPDGITIVGVVVLKPLSSTCMKLRQMAVEPLNQRKGIGGKLLKYAEEVSRSLGFHVIEMNARVSALKFYEKFGYEQIGEEFTEVFLPIIKMFKNIR